MAGNRPTPGRVHMSVNAARMSARATVGRYAARAIAAIFGCKPAFARTQ
jgi:hypothetical protein